ncbi:MAG: RnfABCDGE type electron transport complex subunit B, partial [Gammaproteobacteria bacterium]|nr:RnfABCDGE type electron transport complex subunit B [Gammaproteobacteria bacterium]
NFSVAVVREDECIGCTKCIQACPVDAILGGPKLMHTVIASECTGCDLCVEPCPVDCIDMVSHIAPSLVHTTAVHFDERSSSGSLL